jgi:tetratricopeptide (TPR) repeat protein
VQHAHQKAIIHRDLKPSNVLVMTQDGKRIPKIIDFGVAKATAQRLTEKTMFTQLGVLIGTPEYMSPEQAEMTGEDVDTRTDVYSLGVMLYELLVGVLPFDSRELRSAGLEGIRKKIREEEPLTPSRRLITLGDRSTESANRRSVDRSTLQRELKGDLDWITMKSLAKDRTRRYGSPSELAGDIARYLHHEPVLARPPSTAYRVGKFVRRHKLGVAAASVLLAGVVVGIVGSTVGLIQARRSEARALAEAQRSQRVAGFLEGLLSDVSPARMGDVLREDVRERVKQSKSRDSSTEAEAASALASLDRALAGVPLSDTGIALLDAEILEPMTSRIEGELSDDPVVAARLYFAIAEFQRVLGRKLQAIAAHEKALELRRRALGEDHADTLGSKLELALQYWTVGREEEHLELVTDVAERGARVLGEEHELTLRALGEIADVRMSRSNDEATVREAEEQRIELLETMRRVLGAEHRETLVATDLVAMIYQRRGDRDRAESLYREGLETSRRALGEEDRSTLRTRFNLAVLYHQTGMYDKAESEFLRALEWGERRYGSSSEFVLYGSANLGVICFEQGRYEEAVRYRRKAVEGGLRSMGQNVPQVESWKRALAYALSRVGDYREAESLFREVLGASHGDGDQRREGRAHLGLAELELLRGNAVRARSHLEQALGYIEERGESEDYLGLASFYVLAGDHDPAIRALRKGVEEGLSRPRIAVRADLTPLHGDPEFEALVADPSR